MRNKEDVSLPRRQRPLRCSATHSRPPVSVPFTVHTHCQPPRVRCSEPLRLPLRLSVVNVAGGGLGKMSGH